MKPGPAGFQTVEVLLQHSSGKSASVAMFKSRKKVLPFYTVVVCRGDIGPRLERGFRYFSEAKACALAEVGALALIGYVVNECADTPEFCR